jgi:hypothetical protein
MLRDPRMSEWGNPAVAIPSLLLGGVERTRGTETSQYPQEEKITMIAPVVASERARAQTAGVKAPRGVVGPSPVWTQDDSGTRWKARPQRVTAPYAKSSGRHQTAPEYRGTREILWESAGTIP